MAGAYELEVQASNLVTPTELVVNWTIGTFFNVSQPLELAPIDAPAVARGFPLRVPIPHAALLQGNIL